METFLDCEFVEDGKTIDLISIGIVAEDGREYYAINSECDYENASGWVWENVILPLGFPRPLAYIDWSDKTLPAIAFESKKHLRDKATIAEEIIEFMGGSTPKIWGEWCSYDWVAFCQVFGTMMDLPKGWPMRCRDVVQYCEDHLRLSTDDWPKSLETEGNHNALLGAHTVKKRHEWCRYQESVLARCS
jgi:hypothetical protein